MTLFDWLESTWLSTLVRDSNSVFVYPTILAFHTVGLAFLVGISTALCLRTLDLVPGVPAMPMRKFLPIMYLGFWVNAASGVLLVLIDPQRFLTMTDFYVKLIAIAGAVIGTVVIRRSMFVDSRAPEPRATTRDRLVAGTVLALWGAAITAGRLTAYDDAAAQRQTAIATFVVTALLVACTWLTRRLWQRWKRTAVQDTRAHVAA